MANNVNGAKYWYMGLPVKGLDQTVNLGADKYWITGLPAPLLGGGSLPTVGYGWIIG